MGFFKKFFARFGMSKSKMRLLCVGLDNSGKSTIINWLKPKKAASLEVVPTVGFHLEEFTKNNINFTVFDMSGQGKYRNLWEHYYKETQAIIFVIDTSDKIRLCVAKDELEVLLEHPDIKARKIPILFFANKMDMPNGMTPVECVQGLELDKLTDKPWHITASNALTGQGVEEGINWLAAHIA
eukprot:TRINITY_DN1697_c0_g1_i1.p2 TRINITY_DN1697_c0_g1~~TRINITY_DN1697_c0_g1_i1.p2  ORF type:complete len:183 (+),score=45.54 TRINITY_DN1697_c0_g1_i1:105-653(+)